LEWSHTIFKQVEDKFDRENMDRENLRKDYDYVLMNIWGDAIDDDGLIPYRELMPNIKDIVRNSDREERERLNR
jgi:hypothetical protein